MKISVQKCSSCGESHSSVIVRELEKPTREGWTRFFVCGRTDRRVHVSDVLAAKMGIKKVAP